MPPALPVVRIQGSRRNVGKTWLASSLVTELRARGYEVAAVKHSHHALPVDKPGSDTERFAEAGAVAVTFVSPEGSLERRPRESSLEAVLPRFLGHADIAIVEGFKQASTGATLDIDGDAATVTLTSMDGRPLLRLAHDWSSEEVTLVADALECAFEMSAAGDRQLRTLVRRGAAAHGHLCPGVVLGVRMSLAAARALEVDLPAPRHALEVTVETARCATDAIGAVTGCTLGGRNLRVEERGCLAATYVAPLTGQAVRVRVLDESRALADAYDARLTTRHRQSIAYRLAPDHRLLEVQVPVPA